MRLRALLLGLALVTPAGCGDGDGGTDAGADAAGDVPRDAPADGAPDGDGGGPEGAPAAREALSGVEASEEWSLEGLDGEAWVVRTEKHVPHVYARNRTDLARVQGFVTARARYFMMDLSRRLGLGTVSGLLGDRALARDVESRGIGMRYVAQRLADRAGPELGAYMDAFAAGVNAYVDRVEAGELPPPSELDLAAGLLGADGPPELMDRFERIDVAAMVATVLYQSGFETGDPGRAEAKAKLEAGIYDDGTALAELRRAGARQDVWERVSPIVDVGSAPGFNFGEDGDASAFRAAPGRAPDPPGSAGSRSDADAPEMPGSLMGRLTDRLAGLRQRFLTNDRGGFGSNAWAVTADATAGDAALMAGDGHLSLSVPSLLHRIGLDTAVLGGGETHQLGLTIPGFPLMAIGTNGRVAWSQTQLMGDITDWYAEELRLDDAGRPDATRFRGEWRPLEEVEESYEVAEVQALDSEGRTETLSRWKTFDGRWIASIEGRSVSADAEPGEGEALVNLQGDWVIPEDTDGDGTVRAVSFDYTGLDVGNLLAAPRGFGRADNVEEFREWTKALVAYSQNFAVADAEGSVLYTGYQAVPCRGYLDREPDGSWAEGANPSLLIDGTTYGGFTIPTKPNGKVDEEPGQSDPSKCVVPFDAYPRAIDPEQGYVLNANNDPGAIATDGSLTDGSHYIGGPWDIGFRAETIDRRLGELAEESSADAEAMAELQGNKQSGLAARFVPPLREAIAEARELDDAGDLGGRPAEARLAALYAEHASRFDAVRDRLGSWGERGYRTRSGVDTFYADPDAEARADAVATTIFFAWFGRFLDGTFGDEAIPGDLYRLGSRSRVAVLHALVAGRGEDDPRDLASWNEATGESAYFDRVGTEARERSEEIMLGALADALAYLESEPEGPGKGGFGTEDMAAWRWGLRHQVRFTSLISDFLGDNPALQQVVQQFAITTEELPLAEELPEDDPRQGLTWFPRGGSEYTVDAADPGLSGNSFDYDSGPVMRMVVALDEAEGAGEGPLPDVEVEGRNVVPGGQSGRTESPHFHDQAELWLGNETTPMRFAPASVAEHATEREVYVPAD